MSPVAEEGDAPGEEVLTALAVEGGVGDPVDAGPPLAAAAVLQSVSHLTNHGCQENESQFASGFDGEPTGFIIGSNDDNSAAKLTTTTGAPDQAGENSYYEFKYSRADLLTPEQQTAALDSYLEIFPGNQAETPKAGTTNPSGTNSPTDSSDSDSLFTSLAAKMEEVTLNLTKEETERSIIKVDTLPKFDIEGYISNYTGRTRIDRLLFIAQRSVPLAVEAYKAAIKLLKEGYDVGRYRKAVEQLAALAPDAPEAKIDEEWLNTTVKEATAKIEKLESQLKSYKANMIKEPIRMGQEDVANFYYDYNDLQTAYRGYSRMREFCTQPTHVHEMGMHIIRTCLNPEYSNYAALAGQISRARNLSRDGQDASLNQKLSIASALYELHSEHYGTVAATLLTHMNAALGPAFPEIISQNDIAVYGGICALATMDRETLKAQVIDNSSFRAFLDLEPHILRAVNFFYNAKYSQCLQILEDYKADYLLDVYLSPHVEKLYKTIRRRSISNYFIPFSVVSFKAMAEAFNTPVPALIDELEAMIKEKLLDARLDMEKGTLVQRKRDARQEVYNNAIKAAQDYQREARLRLLQMEFVNKGIKIEGPRQDPRMRGPRDAPFMPREDRW